MLRQRRPQRRQRVDVQSKGEDKQRQHRLSVVQRRTDKQKHGTDKTGDTQHRCGTEGTLISKGMEPRRLAMAKTGLAMAKQGNTWNCKSGEKRRRANPEQWRSKATNC